MPKCAAKGILCVNNWPRGRTHILPVTLCGCWFWVWPQNRALYCHGEQCSRRWPSTGDCMASLSSGHLVCVCVCGMWTGISDWIMLNKWAVRIQNFQTCTACTSHFVLFCFCFVLFFLVCHWLIPNVHLRFGPVWSAINHVWHDGWHTDPIARINVGNVSSCKPQTCWTSLFLYVATLIFWVKYFFFMLLQSFACALVRLRHNKHLVRVRL